MFGLTNKHEGIVGKWRDDPEYKCFQTVISVEKSVQHFPKRRKKKYSSNLQSWDIVIAFNNWGRIKKKKKKPLASEKTVPPSGNIT